MRRFLLTTIVFLFVIHLQASDDLEMSLLTCSKGKDLYSAFGHTALRVIDHKKGTDVVYNFGLFNFNTPYFYSKFVKGRLKYRLGQHSMHEFIGIYDSQHRTIWEQKLNLPEAAKCQIADTLKYLYKPENRYYLYHFLDKNCTTEIRDLIFRALDLDHTLKQKSTRTTYRKMLGFYLQNRPWVKAGIDLVTGSKLDTTVNQYQHMALPKMLMDGVDTVTINGHPLVSKKRIVLEVTGKHQNYYRHLSPQWILTLLLLLWVSFKPRFFVPTVWLLTSLTGAFILLLQIVSEHTELLSNWNLLWVQPLYFLLLVPQIRQNKAFSRLLVIVFMLAMVLRLIIAVTGAQLIPWALTPWMIMLTISLLDSAWPLRVRQFIPLVRKGARSTLD